MRRQENTIFAICFFLITFISSCEKEKQPPDQNPIDFSNCIIPGSNDSFDIISFNIELFPKRGVYTIEAVADLIDAMDADIIALQEISSETNFNKLINELEGWQGLYYLINNSVWNLAYLYKPSEVSIDESKSKVLFENDFQAFPRPPFEIHVSHNSTGINSIIINNHLKCCGGSDNELRRRNAADSLHKYIQNTYPDQEVIILGDLNDEISGMTRDNNVFWSFIQDSLNFRFTDMGVAMGSNLSWSYPSYPSHIDHICVSNELFARIDTTIVFKPGQCYGNFDSYISDHRPVYLRLK